MHCKSILLVLLLAPLLMGAQMGNLNVGNISVTNASYADLYEDSGGTVIDVASAGTYYQWVSTTVGTETGANLADADVTSDNITIGKYGGGVYYINVVISFEGENNAVVHCGVHLGGVKQDNLSFNRNMAANSTVGSASVGGLLTLANTNVVDLRCTSDTNGDDVTVYHANLSVVRVGL